MLFIEKKWDKKWEINLSSFTDMTIYLGNQSESTENLLQTLKKTPVHWMHQRLMCKN